MMLMMMRLAFGRSGVTVSVLVLILLGSLSAVPVSAAGSTAIELTPAEATIDVGNNTAFDIVVTSVDGGVGAYELTLDVADPDAAGITEVTRLGDPGIGSVEIAADGASADVEAGLMDTADTGSVTIARVTVEGKANGTSDLQLAIQALGDEAGARYDVTATRDAALTVGTGAPATDTDATSRPSPATERPAGGAGVGKATESTTSTAGTAATASRTGTPNQPTESLTSQRVVGSGTDRDGSAGDRSATTGSDTATPPETPASPRVSTRSPGFGTLSGLLALGSVVVLVWVRLER